MNMKRWSVVALMVFACIGAYLWGRFGEPARAGQSRENLAAATTAPQQPVVREVVKTIVVNTAPAARPEPEGEPEPSVAELSETSDAKGPASVEEMHQGLNKVYDEQAIDPRWARESERELQGKITGLLQPGSELKSLECRGTMCRSDVEYPSERAFSDFVSTAIRPSSRIWDGPIFNTKVSETPDGRMVMRTYYGRRDVGLPSVAAPEE